MDKKTHSYLTNEDFSIVLGGPFFQMMRKAKLSGNALESAKSRTLIMALFTWLPLLIFSFIAGKALTGSAVVPFLEDIGVHIRYLVALPLMVFAELLVHKRMRTVVKQFVERKLIHENAMDKFNAAIASAMKWRNSLFAELFIIVFVYVVGVHFVWRPYALLDATAWYTYSTESGNKLSLAGIWFGYVSTPLFQFLILRWYYRIFIWSRFIWQISRIQLNFNPLHPDKVGGLGFLSEIDSAFLPLALVHGAVLSGLIADRIFHLGASLPDFKVHIVIIVAWVWCILLVPLMLFAGQLAHAKRKGIVNYGKLAAKYVRDFDEKWLQNTKSENETLVGSADIQSLADLSNSYETVKKMSFTPITKETLITLTAMTLLPVLPLALTMMPLEELAKKLIEILL